MKNSFSTFSLLITGLVLLLFRFLPFSLKEDKNLMVTDWDALGYYMYLPGIFIYDDYKKFDWLAEINEKYAVTGGDFYQASKLENGNYVGKYFAGVAILQSPLFFIGHLSAGMLGYDQDGFSPPYQWAISLGVIFYVILSLFGLRYVLLQFFNDRDVAVTLVLLTLASNLIQYVSIHNGMSHGFIFPLYVLILFFTFKWHERPAMVWAFAIGMTIGLATICRPTEAIMLFIPLLWGIQNKDASKEKWAKVKSNKSHIYALVVGGTLAIAPQIIYWKSVTGSFVHNVGSKWEFFNPHFRVLFGPENGWFVYTPVALFFVLGFFFLKKYPFKKSVLYFCLINIWIIIAWHDWRYGATYSTRALSQSYPVFAFALAALVHEVSKTKFKIPFYGIGIFLIAANLFQIKQYNEGIIHYHDMNWQYLKAIYLDADPTPLDMSLLDTQDFLYDENDFSKEEYELELTPESLEVKLGNDLLLFEYPDSVISNSLKDIKWLKFSFELDFEVGPGPNDFLTTGFEGGEPQTKIRLLNPITKPAQANRYEFFFKLQEKPIDKPLQLRLEAGGEVRLKKLEARCWMLESGR
jgi:hypothetical protein